MSSTLPASRRSKSSPPSPGGNAAATLSPVQGRAIIGHFRRHLAQRYNVLELTPALFTEAMSVARKHGLRAYDAVQLTAALGINRLNQEDGYGPVTLVSADRELNAAAAAEGLAVEDPMTHPWRAGRGDR